ncbi:hypothetical protein LZ31DRAFT_560525 [Colletotrichum somersetense]|nr:hypothetical protein LZ31DRAFT_560525 [Colletotrichum somersetense]
MRQRGGVLSCRAAFVLRESSCACRTKRNEPSTVGVTQAWILIAAALPKTPKPEDWGGSVGAQFALSPVIGRDGGGIRRRRGEAAKTPGSSMTPAPR